MDKNKTTQAWRWAQHIGDDLHDRTYRLSVFDRYAGREVYRSGPCVSTGELEGRIFAFLDS